MLDCSTKGLASPSFTFKTSISLALESSSLSKASLGLATSSSSLGQRSSEGSESPKAMDYLKTADADHDSLSSFNSATSATSNPIQSPRTSRQLSKTQSHASTKRMLNQVHSKLSDPLLVSPSSSLLTASPATDHKSPKPKFSVGHFVEGLLKPKRKPQHTSVYPEGDAHNMPPPDTSPLASPVMDDGQFTMSTVFHIYYSHAKNAQVYKSVLISQDSTANEVVKQAMERYGMKFMDPSEFTLFEVIGRWESIANPNMRSLESCLGILGDSPTSSPARSLALGANTKISTNNGSSNSTQNKTAPAMEEFVVCYTRELQPGEQPYTIQCYHLVPDGYTRRFELRSKKSENNNQEKNDTSLPPTTPIFGATAHRKGASRRNKLHTLGDSFEYPEAPSGEGSTHQGGLMSPGKLLPSSVPDLTLLDCSSPDSGVELQKDSRVSTKSSITSEQSDNGQTTASHSCGLYPIPNSCPFLLNLSATRPGKDLLAYQLLGDRLVLIGSSTDSTSSDQAATSPHTRDDQIELTVPEACSGKLLCSITREAVPDADRPTSRCLLAPGDTSEPHSVLLNSLYLNTNITITHQ